MVSPAKALTPFQRIATVDSLTRVLATEDPRQAFIRLITVLLEAGLPDTVSAHAPTAAEVEALPGPQAPLGVEYSRVPYPRLMLPLNGQCRIARELSNRRHDVTIPVGQLYWIHPDDSFFIRKDASRILFSVVFHAKYTRYVWLHRHPTPGAPSGWDVWGKTMLYYHTHAPASTALSQAVAMMESAQAHASKQNPYVALKTAQALLAWSLHELHAETSGAADDPGQRLFTEISAYLSEHLGTDINREGVAGYFRISNDHLTRIFRRHAGCGFNEYVRNQRLEQARKLLTNSRLSIKEIAFVCGFTDYTYFIKRFREHC